MLVVIGIIIFSMFVIYPLVYASGIASHRGDQDLEEQAEYLREWAEKKRLKKEEKLRGAS